MRDTKGQGHCRPYCLPVAVGPPVPVGLPDDDAVFSIAATKLPAIAIGPNE